MKTFFHAIPFLHFNENNDMFDYMGIGITCQYICDPATLILNNNNYLWYQDDCFY